MYSCCYMLRWHHNNSAFGIGFCVPSLVKVLSLLPGLGPLWLQADFGFWLVPFCFGQRCFLFCSGPYQLQMICDLCLFCLGAFQQLTKKKRCFSALGLFYLIERNWSKRQSFWRKNLCWSSTSVLEFLSFTTQVGWSFAHRSARARCVGLSRQRGHYKTQVHTG